MTQPPMSKPSLPGIPLALAVVFSCAATFAQTSAKNEGLTQDFTREGSVIEQKITRVIFQTDGTYTYEQHARVRIHSDAGVRQYGVLPFPYEASVERIEVKDVRVTKSDGSVLVTPLDSIQDVTSETYRDAPMYSDLREKHVAVKGLEPGNMLEYSVLWVLEKPLAKGQFWTGYQFTKSSVILDEELEISVPAEREVKLKSQVVQPTILQDSGRRIYRWKTSNLESESAEKRREMQGYDAFRGLLPPVDVLISSFRTWDEVGRWYDSLQQDRIQVSPEIRAKADEITKGLVDDDAKLRAIYNYVSLHYRYVAIFFGIGRYQPHDASEILRNQYGDCKDKHTLLAALLNAVGIHAYPALINSGSAVDVEVPSPGQFNHVITVVSKGKVLTWMDTTPEVTSTGFLINSLRAKPALVIMPEKVAFETTPASPPFANQRTDLLTAKINSDGTLLAHIESSDRGDWEIYSRYSFRRWPESQWKDLVQKISYAAHLGATISDVQVSSPEKTEEPFRLAYDYTLKDFIGGDNHRFVVPLPPAYIPEVKDEDLKRKTPFLLGYAAETQYEARIELPKGWSATPPSPIDLKESFAEFQGSSEVREGVLITKRHMLLKTSAVTPDQLAKYQTFEKAVSDYYDTYVYLHSNTDIAASRLTATAQPSNSAGDLFRQAVLQLPDSSNLEALHAEQNARKSLQTKDVSSATTALKYAVSLDAGFSRAWIELASVYAQGADKSSSLSAFQKAVDADPKQVVPYKILAVVYMSLGKRDDAISTWQRLQGVAPHDPDLAPSLGALYMTQKRYEEATTLFAAAVQAQPSNAYAHMSLGMVQLRSHNKEQALAELHKALEIDSGAEMLNNVAYEMAEADTELSDALAYSQRSVKNVEDRSQKVDLEKTQKEDWVLPMTLNAYWDTLGWIYFKMGDLKQAESYLNSAWQISQDGMVGDHLGQVYEKEKRLPAALHMYNLALEANPRLEETPSRMRGLAHVPLPKNRMSAGEELSQMRTVKVPTMTKESSSADFDVLLVGGRIEKTRFVSGSELLREGGDALQKTSFEQPLPANSTVHLLRRGVLSCSSYTGCSFVFYPLSVAARANQKSN